eukprot:6473971-Amphidinium_carterae.3
MAKAQALRTYTSAPERLEDRLTTWQNWIIQTTIPGRAWSSVQVYQTTTGDCEMTARGEVPMGRGAWDETFDLAFETEQTTAGIP